MAFTVLQSLEEGWPGLVSTPPTLPRQREPWAGGTEVCPSRASLSHSGTRCCPGSATPRVTLASALCSGSSLFSPGHCPTDPSIPLCWCGQCRCDLWISLVYLMTTISGAMEPSRGRTEWDGLVCFVWIFFFFNPYSFISFAPPGLSYSMWDLVPWTKSEFAPPVLGAWSLSCWTTREVSWVL